MCDKKKVGILGLGKYMPEKRLTNKDLEKIVDTTDEWIMTRSGIKERRIARDDQATSDMATEAAKIALMHHPIAYKLVVQYADHMIDRRTDHFLKNSLTASA